MRLETSKRWKPSSALQNMCSIMHRPQLLPVIRQHLEESRTVVSQYGRDAPGEDADQGEVEHRGTDHLVQLAIVLNGEETGAKIGHRRLQSQIEEPEILQNGED